MVSRYFQRPENVRKRALELLDVGKRERALDILYEFIRRGRHRQHNFSEKELEPILFMYLDLCVELKKSHNAKEGLFQYRNFCQNVNVASLENVVRGYLKNAEQKTEAARKESQDAVEEVDDLENLVSPEQLLLSAVSSEDNQDRSDRTILMPWVKFLWESYRQCLELLKTNSRVESLYHDTARQAFRFCVKYQRKTEFRKLCEILRKHLDQLKHSASSTISLTNADTLARNMETWLAQLDHAIALELWQEAYRAIYELHGLMTRSKTKPKAQMMASYFAKLSLVFAKAGNLLFHAASVLRLFQLSRDLKKNLSQDDLKLMACRVLLAVLSVPLTAAHLEFDRFVETEKNVIDKTERLASFFRMPKVPTRESLLKDLSRYSIMQYVSEDLQRLYEVLEVQFDPLAMCGRVLRCTEALLADPAQQVLHWYVEPLHQVAQLRFIKQIGQVYQTVQLSRLVQLCPFTDEGRLERVIVDAVRRNQLQIRMDHRQRAVHFGADLSEFQREDGPEGPMLQPMPSEQIRCQLMSMCSVLFRAQRVVNPDYKKAERADLRASIHRNYHASKRKEHERIRNRQSHIEEHKERMEHINTERVEEERSRVEEQERKQMAEEQQRLDREAAEREKKRREDEIKQIAARHLKTRIAQISQTSVGQKVISKLDEEELLAMDADEIMARQVEELEKERKEQAAKLANHWRRIDHVERAKRTEEIPLLKNKYEQQKVEDAALWDEQQKTLIAQAMEDHEQSMKHKERMQRMHEDKDSFVDKLKSARKSDFKAKFSEFETRLSALRCERLEERKRQRMSERRTCWFKEREEEEQQRRDEEAKRQREEQERIEQERAEEEAEEYRKHKEHLDAVAAKQLAKEREVEDKIARTRAEAAGGGGWRERELRREVSWRPSDAAGGGGGVDVPRRDDVPARGANGWRGQDSGARRVDDGPRRVDDGPRRVDDGPRRVDDGPRRSDDGPRRFDDGPRRSDDGPRRFDDGPRRSDDGPRRFDDGPRRFDDGPRRSDDGPRRFDDGPRRSDGPRTDEGSSWRSGGDSWRRSEGPRRENARADDGPRRDAARVDDGPRRADAWRRPEEPRREAARFDDAPRRDGPRLDDAPRRGDAWRKDDSSRMDGGRDDGAWRRGDGGRRDGPGAGRDEDRDSGRWGRSAPAPRRDDDRWRSDGASKEGGGWRAGEGAPPKRDEPAPPRRDEPAPPRRDEPAPPRRDEPAPPRRDEPAPPPKENVWRRREQTADPPRRAAPSEPEPPRRPAPSEQKPAATGPPDDGWTTVRR